MNQQASQQQVGEIMLTNWRIAFAHGLWTPSTVQGQGRPAFSASFIAPPNHPDIIEATMTIGENPTRTAPSVQQVIHAVALQKWGSEGDQILQALIAGGRICLRDGNAKPNVEGYPGNLFISARSPTRPNVFDQNVQSLDQTSGKPYSGCYVNARVNIWAQQNQYGRRINAQLAGVQFTKDGEPFSAGGAADADEFGEIEGAAQAGSEFGDLFGGNQVAPQAPAQLLGQPQQPAPVAQPQPGVVWPGQGQPIDDNIKF